MNDAFWNYKSKEAPTYLTEDIKRLRSGNAELLELMDEFGDIKLSEIIEKRQAALVKLEAMEREYTHAH